MPPNSANSEPVIHEEVEEEQLEKLVAPQAGPRKYKIVYPNLVTFGYGHIALLYGIYLMFSSAKWQTIFFTHVMLFISGFGITAGAHRLWAHRTYKAKMPLQILLMLLNTLAFQNSVMDWVRDHRLHHKYSDTDADPHNATRGFFYSHVGWLLVRKHKEVKRRGMLIDLSDIKSNPVLAFQKKYAIPLVSFITFIMPTAVPMYFWGETFNNAWHIATVYRYVFALNATFLVNSAAHYWGYKPYDKNMKPSQNHFVSLFALGEGFHNYHHVFPWDYRTAELGNNFLNPTTKFINFFAWIGWAYDLKAAPDDMITNRKIRTGDGSSLWGWGDKEQSKEEIDAAIRMYPAENEKDK